MNNVSPHFIDLLRHGQPQGGDRFRGTRDDPLSENGWDQMRASVATMGDSPGWELIVTSPLLRCAEFAGDLAERLNLPVETDPGFAELAFGEWEGVRYDDMRRDTPGAFEAFFSDPLNHTPPGGEPIADFCGRIDAAWDLLLDRHRGKHLLLVCHGAVMRAIYRRILATPLERFFRIEVPYACLTRVRRHPEGDRLVFHRGQE